MNKYSKEQVKNIISFLQYSEGLKTESRSINLSTGEPENVAAHSWRMALMVMTIAPHLEKKGNIEQMLKMCIVHDLVEVEAGDVSVLKHAGNQEELEKKSKAEHAAMQNILTMFSCNCGEEIRDLWEDYETQNSYEAQVVKAIDKLEARLQVLLDKTHFYTEEDKKKMIAIKQKVTTFCSIDPLLSEMDKVTLEMLSD